MDKHKSSFIALSLLLSVSVYQTQASVIVDIPPSYASHETLKKEIENYDSEYFYNVNLSLRAMIESQNMVPNARFYGSYGLPNGYPCHPEILNPVGGHASTSNTDSPQNCTSVILQHFFPSPAGGGFLRLPALVVMDFIGRISNKKITDLLKIYVSYTEKMDRAQNDVEKNGILEMYKDQFLVFFKDNLQSLQNDDKSFKRVVKEWKEEKLVLELPQIYSALFIGAYEERDNYPDHFIETILLLFVCKKEELKGKNSLGLINDSPFKSFFTKKGKSSKEKNRRVFSEELYWETRKNAIKAGHRLDADKFKEWLQDPELLFFMTWGYQNFENRFPRALDTGRATYKVLSHL